MVIKAVLFDLDGVLVDAREWHYAALNEALSLFGMEISRYDHLVTYDGLPTRKKLEMLTLERGLASELHAFINEVKQQYTLDQIHRYCRPVFAVEYAVSRLRTEGHKLAVCSNSIRKSVDVMLDKSMILHHFDAIFSTDDVKNPKPDPEMYETCMHDLAVSPAETLILEDNQNGIKAAIDSGAHLMRIDDITEVNYFGISAVIERINEESAC